MKHYEQPVVWIDKISLLDVLSISDNPDWQDDPFGENTIGGGALDE